MGNAEPSGAVKSAIRTLDVLELLVDQARPMAAHEIAGALAIPMSSLSYLLGTLVERGYVERSGRLYAIGPTMARLRARDDSPTLAERAAPLLRMLRHELNETAVFFVRRGFEIEAVASETGVHALRYSFEVGQRAPLHSVSAGKALLATMTEEELDEYFRNIGRTASTPHTLTSEDELRAEIVEIRRSGVARSREEHTLGVCAVSRAAVADRIVLGAFSVAVPTARYDKQIDDKALRLLIRAAEKLSQQCG